MAERPAALRLSDAKPAQAPRAAAADSEPAGATATVGTTTVGTTTTGTAAGGRDRERRRVRQLLLPVLWEGALRRKGDWLPRWEEVFVTLDGAALRVYETRAKYDEALALEERQLRLRFPLPCGSPAPRRRKSAAASARTASASSLASASSSSLASASSATSSKGNPAARRSPAASSASVATAGDKKDRFLTVTGVERESVGRPHGFCVLTREKKPLHLAADSELERVVWVHLLQAAVDQATKLLPKAQKLLADDVDAAALSGGTDPSADSVSALPPASSLASRVQVPGVLAKTLLGLPIEVDLGLFYDAWGLVQCRKGNFADLVPSLHPNITITSNYPPSVPIAGEYHGRAGFLAFIANLHGSIDVSHYLVQHMARSGDLAVVTGRETIKSMSSGRKFRHLWRHELRFEADGRVSHINILADKVAAAVAFGVQTEGPSLELPHEQEASATTCPPGEIRVVCISGERIKRKKPLPPSATLKVVVGLNNFPHWTLKSTGGGSGSGSSGGSSGGNGPGSVKGFSHVGSWKSYATRPSKPSNGANPFWAETLSLQFSGAVPGTSACIFIEVWSLSVMGDDLVGCTKVNLANYLGTSAGTEEEIAAAAVPRWFELRKPEYFTSGSGMSLVGSNDSGDAPLSSSSSTNSGGKSPETCGRLQLSISFVPYTDEFNASFGEEGNEGEESRTPQHRKSFDRLQALHEEAGDRPRGDPRASADGADLDGSYEMIDREETAEGNDADDATTSRSRASLVSSSSSSATPSGASIDEMYSFTVASTKFRVYTRYQLIRAIGHGAYGVVIAASDQVTGNSVAIKNIPKTFDDLVDAKRIVREIRLMRHLQHPNIVTVLDVMRPPSLAAFEDTYIVTDLMETDLHRVINSPEPLSSDHIAYITYQMLCGVRYMHSAQILHRDIKPSNVLVNRDCLVKICDFGLARGIDPVAGGGGGEPLDQALTEYVVTRWYRAPELLLASRYSTAIDVWSIGCIMVEMFTRRALFPGHDHVHQLHLILQLVGSPSADDMGFITNIKAKRWMARQPRHERKPFDSVCPGAPALALDLMEKLLRFDPRQRATVDEAIAHPFLAAYRNPELEARAATAFDFSFEKDASKKMDKDALRRLIFEDVCHFHPDARAELDEHDRAQQLRQQRLQVEEEDRQRARRRAQQEEQRERERLAALGSGSGGGRTRSLRSDE